MEDKNKVLIIKSFRDDFENYYNDRMKQEGIKIWNDNIDDRKYSSNLIIRQLQMCVKMVKNGWIKDIKAYECIIIFDYHSLIPWIFLFKRHAARIILWKWNIATPKIVRQIKAVQRLCEVWTFDRNDAEQYGWYLNNQFYFYPYIKTISQSINREEGRIFFFIGKDKGRYEALQKIDNILRQNRMYSDFWLVKDDHVQYNVEHEEWIKDVDMPYDQVLEHIAKCDAVLDIVQDVQSGFTVRVLEALFYQKKLITNNKDILNSDLYSSNNVFVIDYDNWDDLKAFMQKPYKALAKEVLDSYTFVYWLKNFKKTCF